MLSGKKEPLFCALCPYEKRGRKKSGKGIVQIRGRLLDGKETKNKTEKKVMAEWTDQKESFGGVKWPRNRPAELAVCPLVGRDLRVGLPITQVRAWKRVRQSRILLHCLYGEIAGFKSQSENPCSFKIPWHISCMLLWFIAFFVAHVEGGVGGWASFRALAKQRNGRIST